MRDVERVAPVVVRDVTVVLLDRGQPSTQNGVVDVEPAREVEVDEHAKGSLEYMVVDIGRRCCCRVGLIYFCCGNCIQSPTSQP